MEDIVEMEKFYLKNRIKRDQIKLNKLDPEQHKEKQKAYMLEKINCPYCYMMTARCNMTKHQNTKKCRKISFQIHLIKEKEKNMEVELIRKELYDLMKGIVQTKEKKNKKRTKISKKSNLKK